MRVLHVAAFNIAGVPGLLVKGLRLRGIDADFVVNSRHPYGFPFETVVNGRGTKFLRVIASMSRGYDIVHIHGMLSRYCIDVFALKLLRRKLILHFHGTELRHRHNLTSVKMAQKVSDKVLVSTPDLLAYSYIAEWLPNPIDPIFEPMNNIGRSGRALYFRKEYEPEKERIVRKKCAEMNLRLTVPNSLIPYKEMPSFLNQFEVFFDRFSIPSLSKTALEALACGCKVVGWKWAVIDPEEILKTHSLEFVTEELLKIYESLVARVDISLLRLRSPIRIGRD